MFKNYFKTAWRNLKRNRGYSIINIGGLAMGMAAAMLIGLWIYDEMSFNRQFENGGRIAQVLQNQTFNGDIETSWSQAMQLEPELRDQYSDYFEYVVTTPGTYDQLLTFGDKKITKSGSYMGPDITEMLSLKMLEGTRNALKSPNSVLLAESTARALFGEENPMDKSVEINNNLMVTVKGVYQDLPLNSTFGDLTFIAPWALEVERRNLKERTDWRHSWFYTYVQVSENADIQQVSALIEDVKFTNMDAELANKSNPKLFLLPMIDWYLSGDFENGTNTGGRIEYLWLFGIIAFFVLLLACINFMNLVTARSEKRAKEIGIRKTLGSLRSQLAGQFMGESMLVAVLAFILSLIIVVIILPSFNELAEKQIDISWSNLWFWLVCIGYTIFTGLLAGTYPSLYLSAFQPAKTLKGSFRSGRFEGISRRFLVVVQFTASISLIIGTLFIYRQVQFVKDRPIGYNRDHLVRIPVKTNEIVNKFQPLRTDLLNTGMVDEIAGTSTPLTATTNTYSNYDWEGKDPGLGNEFIGLQVTHNFGKIIDWEVLDGRDFSKEYKTDKTGFILNEAALEYMGLQNPIGKVMTRAGNNYEIIGVVKDLVTQSPYDPVKATIFMLDENWFNHLYIKLDPSYGVQEALNQIESIFSKYDTLNPFDYEFVDQAYALKFQNSERIGKLASFFAILAIFISCLGLFGLVSFVAEKRIKELGIRKILGASMANLLRMLSKEFLILVLISYLTAALLAYYFINRWLQQYEYRTELSWLPFAITGGVVLVLTVLTVSYQTIRAARANPIESLRME
jgi:ABC-type antimicrobial peptide transport system permease subunit